MSSYRRTISVLTVAVAVVCGGLLIAPLARAARTTAPHVGLPTLLTMSSGYVTPNGSFTLVVTTSGAATLKFVAHRADHFKLGAVTLRTLKRELTATNFKALHRRYTRVVNPIVGVEATSIKVGAKTVTVGAGAQAPATLTRLISALWAIVSVR